MAADATGLNTKLLDAVPDSALPHGLASAAILSSLHCFASRHCLQAQRERVEPGTLSVICLKSLWAY